MEILNAMAIDETSAPVYLVGQRMAGSKVATAAAVLYACHSLVFPFHGAREVFVTALGTRRDVRAVARQAEPNTGRLRGSAAGRGLRNHTRGRGCGRGDLRVHRDCIALPPHDASALRQRMTNVKPGGA